jgi:hypothetical protein
MVLSPVLGSISCLSVEFDRMSVRHLGHVPLLPACAQDVVEWQRFGRGALVVKRRFFRHPATYELVTRHLSHLNRVSLWSCGCSTGEEAWSLQDDDHVAMR